jgi:hypothetical protein
VLTTERLKKKVLGMAVGERGLLIAEVACAPAGGARVVRGGEFVYPAGLSLERPEALGAALGAFLKERGFETRRAVVGVPARWLLVKQHSLPPADAEAAAAMLWLRAETESVPELGEMVFDYSGEARAEEATSILLMGLPKRWVDRLAVMAKSAGIQIAAVTPGAVALGAVSAAKMGSPYSLVLGAEAAELCAYEGAQARILRHLGPNGSLASLLGELRRAAVTHALEGVASGGDGIATARTGRQLVVWDSNELDEAGLEAIGETVHLPVTRGEVGRLLGASVEGERAGAVAVALGLSGGRVGVDFLRPRVVAPRGQGVSRRTAWMSGAAAVVAIVALLAIFDLTRMQRQLGGVDEELQGLEPSLKTAKPFVQNMQFVETFGGNHPKYLACLRDVTLAIPVNPKTYLTNFHLKANMKGEISGRAGNSQDVLNVTDQLNASGHFTDLKRKLEAGAKSGDVAFTVTFSYAPH